MGRPRRGMRLRRERLLEGRFFVQERGFLLLCHGRHHCVFGKRKEVNWKV